LTSDIVLSRVRASPEDTLAIWLLYVTTSISFAHGAPTTGSLKVENGSKAPTCWAAEREFWMKRPTGSDLPLPIFSSQSVARAFDIVSFDAEADGSSLESCEEWSVESPLDRSVTSSVSSHKTHICTCSR